MAREKKPVHKVQMTEGKRNIIHQLLDEYDIQSAEDIQEALKDLLGGTIKEMMEAELLLTCYSCSFHSFSVLSALLFCKISYNYPHPFKCSVVSDAGISSDLP